jgi:hypothetical protein
MVAVLGMVAIGGFTSAHAAVSARAVGAWINAPSRSILDETICDTGWLPPEGGHLNYYTYGAVISDVLSFASMTASSDHDNDDCDGMTTAVLSDVTLFPGQPGELRFDSLHQNDDDDCCNNDDNDFFAGQFSAVTLNGQPLVVTGLPDQTVDVPGVGVLVFNELKKKNDDDCDDDDFTQNAVHFYGTNGDEVILGSVHHDNDNDCCSTQLKPRSWGGVKQFYR